MRRAGVRNGPPRRARGSPLAEFILECPTSSGRVNPGIGQDRNAGRVSCPRSSYDKLDELAALAQLTRVVWSTFRSARRATSACVVLEPSRFGTERGYPSSIAQLSTRGRPGVDVPQVQGRYHRVAVAACIGTKEFVGACHWLRLRNTVARHSAVPAGLPIRPMRWARSSPVSRGPRCRHGRTGRWTGVNLGRGRGAPLCLGQQSRQPGRASRGPGGVGHGGAPTACRSSQRVLGDSLLGLTLFHDLQHRHRGSVVSTPLSKTSNLAGCGRFLRRRRRSCRVLVEVAPGMPGSCSRTRATRCAVALGEDSHVERQRAIYLARLERFAEILSQSGIDARLPSGSFYLWVAVPKGFEPHGGAGEANRRGR